MSWSYKIKQLNKDYHKIICDIDTLEVIAIVDNLDEDFVTGIINMHNVELGLAYREGLKEGNKVTREVYKIKD